MVDRPIYGPPPPVPDWMVMIVDTVAESMELGWFCTDLCDHASGIYQCERHADGSECGPVGSIAPADPHIPGFDAPDDETPS